MASVVITVPRRKTMEDTLEEIAHATKKGVFPRGCRIMKPLSRFIDGVTCEMSLPKVVLPMRLVQKCLDACNMHAHAHGSQTLCEQVNRGKGNDCEDVLRAKSGDILNLVVGQESSTALVAREKQRGGTCAQGRRKGRGRGRG